VSIDRNLIASELLQVVRFLTAGRLEPPPKMVKPIVDFCLKAREFFQAQSQLGRMLHGPEAEDHDRNIAVHNKLQAKGDERTSAEDKQLARAVDMIEFYEEELKKAETRFAKAQRLFPRGPAKWDEITQDFNVDLSGWKYAKLLNDVDRFPYTNHAKKWYKRITVEAVKESKPGMDRYSGMWSFDPPTITVVVLRDDQGLLSVVRHELMHFAQSFMSFAMTNKLDSKAFGAPPKKLRQPEQTYEGGETVGPAQEQDPQSYRHTLTDIEFQTDLENATGDWDRLIGNVLDGLKRKQKLLKMSELPTKLTRDSKRKLFNTFIGKSKAFKLKKMSPYEQLHYVFEFDYEVEPSRCFTAWKRGAPKKWKRAVKELAKHAKV